MSPEELPILERIARALERIADSFESVVCKVNEGEEDEVKALNIWKEGGER
jgi:hypothetical protein